MSSYGAMEDMEDSDLLNDPEYGEEDDVDYRETYSTSASSSRVSISTQASLAGVKKAAKKPILVPKRVVVPNSDKVNPSNLDFPNNRIRTTNFLTGFPRELINQIINFVYVYFVLITVINWLPQMQSYMKEFQLVQLIVLLLMSVAIAFRNVCLRTRVDSEVNNRLCRIYRGSKGYVSAKWKDIHVGDLVQVECNEVIPADVLILKTAANTDVCYIDTSGFDGKMDLVQISAVKLNLALYGLSLTLAVTKVECNPSDALPFNLSGVLVDKNNRKIQFNKENTAIRGSILRNTAKVEAIVLFAGRDTKLMMNKCEPTEIWSIIERLSDLFAAWHMILLCFFVLTCLVKLKTWKNTFDDWISNNALWEASDHSFLEYFYSAFILVGALQVIVPMSLPVFTAVSKVAEATFIDAQKQLKHRLESSKCRFFNVLPHLGQIEYVFADKTGTLTKKRLYVKRCSISGNDYRQERKETSAYLTLRSLKSLKSQSKTDAFSAKYSYENVELQTILHHVALDSKRDRLMRRLKQPRFQRIENFFIVLAVCNSVNLCSHPKRQANPEDPLPPSPRARIYLPQTESSQDLTRQIYEGASAEELAMVEAAYNYNYRLVKRTADSVTITLPGGEICEFKILVILPFDSYRKRMSIILENTSSKQKVLYCKGAESVIFDRLVSIKDAALISFHETTRQHILKYAKQGLQTFCAARRVLETSTYKKWLASYEQLKQDPKAGVAQLRDLIGKIEINLELLGAAGLEDTIDDGVLETIASLRAAGIKIWILSGDHQQTLKNVTYLCGLATEDTDFICINQKTKGSVQEAVAAYISKLEDTPSHLYQKSILAVDSVALNFILKSNLNRSFLALAVNVRAVILSRLTPGQKTAVVRLVRNRLNATTLAIGDGPSDIGMLQKAHVGVAVPREGAQEVAMESDLCIPKFRYLDRLILVEGQWGYWRLWDGSLYILQGALTVALIHFWYQHYCGFSGTILIDTLRLSLYHTVMLFPTAVFIVYEQKCPAPVLLRYPTIYKHNKKFTPKLQLTFWLNALEGLYFSVTIFLTVVFAYSDGDVSQPDFGILISNCIILVQCLNLMLRIRSWTILNVLAFGLVAVVLYVSNFVEDFLVSRNVDDYLKDMQNMTEIPKWWLTLLLVAVVSVLPRLIAEAAINTCMPSEQTDLLQREKAKAEADAFEEAIHLASSDKTTVHAVWFKKRRMNYPEPKPN